MYFPVCSRGDFLDFNGMNLTYKNKFQFILTSFYVIIETYKAYFTQRL